LNFDLNTGKNKELFRHHGGNFGYASFFSNILIDLKYFSISHLIKEYIGAIKYSDKCGFFSWIKFYKKKSMEIDTGTGN
jgi:hypothetical protein